MATIKDVAKKAGVSVTTVSRVLNQKGYISKNTIEAVFSAMDELNYIPNQLARSLYSQKTHLIGLLIPDISHPFFAQITQKLESLLYHAGYKLMLCSTEADADKEHEQLLMLQQNQVDGIIIGTHMLKRAEYEKAKLPIVALDITLGDYIPTIYSNHQKGGELAARIFVENNCKFVLQLIGDITIPTPSLIRHKAFSEYLQKNNIGCINYYMSKDEFNFSSYSTIIDSLLNQYSMIDGIFSVDLITVYALQCVSSKGIRVPQDCKIVGYDGTFIADTVYPKLTHIAQPLDEIAQTLVDTLLKKIEGENIFNDICLDNIKVVKGGTTIV